MENTTVSNEPKTAKLRRKALALRVSVVTSIMAGMVLIGPAAADINWTMITGLIDGMATNLLPSMVTLVTSAVPLLITLAIVGFVMTFLDKILLMLKL